MTLMLKARVGMMIASAALFLADPVFSQEAENGQGEESADFLNELSLGDLLSMKISTGSFLELDLKKSPLSMTIISNEMIKTSGARHMSELLEIYVPGFIYNINRWNGTLWAMRGVANDRNTKIIYLVNGHKMNTQSRDGFQSETVLGMLSDIERVEVLRGPAGLVYGCGAIAGIINVVTKKADDNRSDVSVSANTDGSKTIEANLHATPGDDQKLSVAVGYKQSDGLPYDKSRIYGKASWPPTPGYAYGVPSDGRYGSTPGNFRVAGDWTIKNFNLYLRATRQNEDAAAYYVRDVWPEPEYVFNDKKDATSQYAGSLPRYVDGVVIDPKDSTSFWYSAENYAHSRREYHSDNFMTECSYDLPLDENNLKFKLSYDRNTTRIQYATGTKWEPDLINLEGTKVMETFGEARYMLNTTYLLKSISKLQAAFGIEDRIDRVGPDMNGDNEQDGKDKHYIVRNITYNTLTVFGEGFYDIVDALGVHAGFRLDWHTRALMINPKIALIAKANENHIFKLIYQSASNNGSVDNYEYSRYHVDDNGNSTKIPGPVDLRDYPSDSTALIQPVPSEDVLHELKPEKVHSLEAVYTGTIAEMLSIELSGTIGKVRDLFGWSQELFRVVNVGEYNYFNVDADLKLKVGKFKFGANHTLQRPFNTDVDKQERAYPVWDNDSTGHNGQYGYFDRLAENGDSLWGGYYSQNDTLYLNVVKNSITSDGDYFLSLPANMTKLYMIFTPFDWLSFNTNLRLIWGCPGLEKIVDEQNDPNAYYFGFYHELEDQSLKDYIMRSVSKKWNFGVNVFLPKDFGVSFYVFNILGTDNHSYNTQEIDRNTVNTLRMHHNFSPGELDMYSSDQRTIGMTVTKNF